MLGTAIVLAHRQLEPLPVEGRLGLVQSLYALGNGLALGLSVAGVLLWIIHLARGWGGFLTQPGHWLLLVRGIATLVSFTGGAFRAYWGQEVVEAFVGSRAARIPVLLIIVLQFFPSSLAGTLGYWAALRSRSVEPSVWRLAIGGLFLYTAFNAVTSGLGLLVWLMEGQTEPLPGFTYLAASWSGLLLPLINLVVVVAAVRDPVKRERDFLHWAGVASLIASSILQVAFSLAIRHVA
jgi:hypothetical protein